MPRALKTPRDKLNRLPPLRDRITPGVRILFVGINPGIRSAETIGGAAVFVLPNPSGRNANFSYAEMLAAFRTLKAYTGNRKEVVAPTDL